MCFWWGRIKIGGRGKDRNPAAALAGKATKGEPVAAIVGILRVDVAGVEVQVVAIRGISQSS